VVGAVDMVTTVVAVVDIAIRSVVVVVGIITKGKDASANESTAIGDATVVVDIAIEDVAVVVGMIMKGEVASATESTEMVGFSPIVTMLAPTGPPSKSRPLI